MLSVRSNITYPTVQRLVAEKAASRIQAQDATLYSFSPAAQACAGEFMGWTDLAQTPPYPVKSIQKLADSFADQGMRYVLLIGQGGSTQASMVLTKFYKVRKPRMKLFVLDSDSPVRLRRVLGKCDLKKTLVIVSSKSGGTLEMRLMLSAVRDEFMKVMGAKKLSSHLVAITDPGSPLANQAISEKWASILYGEPAVGGRFSALSVFGLFPAALVGIPLKKLMKHAAKAEELCATDETDNPAIQLAAFLYGTHSEGRNKIAYVSPKRGRALGLWIEQLLAESTGKEGQGILPYLETNPLLLSRDAGDRAVIVYHVESDSPDSRSNFAKGLSCIDGSIPRMDFTIKTVNDLVEHFVLWEYATALCGYLMGVCPFDQPDVASAKAKVTEILESRIPTPAFTEQFFGDIPLGPVEVQLSECCEGEQSVYGALRKLLSGIAPGDYFAINAFLPFCDEGRKRALEDMRFAVANRCGVPSCLEIGPRYLHSTGQMQKGGPNQGVFLVLSAQEPDDIPLEGQAAPSLGTLAHAQASGDAATLAERGRRCLHLHLPDSYDATLALLAALVREVLADIQQEGETPAAR